MTERRYRAKRVNGAATVRLLEAFLRRGSLSRQQMLDTTALSYTAFTKLLGSLEQDFGFSLRQERTKRGNRYVIESLGWFDFRAIASAPSDGRVDRRPDAFRLGISLSAVQIARPVADAATRCVREPAAC